MTRPVVLVTGGSRGIGRAICRDLGRDHHVLVGGRDHASVAQVVQELDSAQPFVCDVADEQSVAEAVASVGRVDVLVHNAGVAPKQPWQESGRDQWREAFELNVFGVVDLTQRLLPALRETRGHVVLINSGAGFTVAAEMALYSATKFALRAFADGLRAEERGRLRVTSIHPGPTDTQMQDALTGPAHEGGVPRMSAESVAATVRMALEAHPDALIETLSVRPSLME